MKTLSKQQIAYEALFDEAAVFEDDDVWEILEEKAEVAWERYVVAYYKHESDEYIERYNRYMGSNGCRTHDLVGCPQCSSYARGECPSAREEGWYDGWD